MSFRIPVLSGTVFDLTKFDFSFKGLRIYNISTPEFEEYLNTIDPGPGTNLEYYKYFGELIAEIRSELDKKYAIVKINPKENFNYDEIENVWKILLIIFPSYLEVTNIVYFHNVGGDFYHTSLMSSRKIFHENHYAGFLDSEDKKVSEINEFIKLVFDRLGAPPSYIGLIIEHYMMSFVATYNHYRFLTLCMALESTVSGSEEVSYKLRRNIAVLCGEDTATCEIIYENLKKIYSERSKIIHGETFDENVVEDYLNPMTHIVSQVIIELLIHNITKNEKLNDIVTRIGYGDREKISLDWKRFHLNENIDLTIILEKAKKRK